MAKSFQIPTVFEVTDFIQNKMTAWPGSFCQWYAEKFWNHYQSSGWRLSSNVLMKDWKAAFCSNWKELKWEAKEKLAECQKAERKPFENTVEVQFQLFRRGSIDIHKMADLYKPLWPKIKPLLTQGEVNKLKADAGNDMEYGRYLSVKLYFTKLIEHERCEHKASGING